MESADASVFASFDVQTLADTQRVDVRGTTLGDLRAALKLQFGIPTFEQEIMYDQGSGLESIDGDDSVNIEEKTGLVSAKVLMLSRQVDPRFQMEKVTAFREALLARRFVEAKEILESSGVTLDPNCTIRYRVQERVAVTECPMDYSHPALTVALMAGLEHAVRCLKCDTHKIETYMSDEEELSELVQLMIEKRADVNAVGDETQDCESAGCPCITGKTPLCAAVQRGSPLLVRMLLEAKADPNHHHTYGQSAWGPDRRNPFGPGQLRPESWLEDVCNGSVSKRNGKDPRNAHREEILAMLRRSE